MFFTGKGLYINTYILSKSKINKINNTYKLSKNNSFNTSKNIKNFEEELKKLQDRYKIKDSEIISLLEKKPRIPISIFSHETSPLESLVKYLKENYSLKFSQIARLLNRDDRTIWITYDGAIKKIKEPFAEKKKEGYIDVSAFAERKFSVLEIVCSHLISLGFSMPEIAVLLNKHRNAIWSACSRFKKKND